MKLALICCLHGNEKYSLKIAKKFHPKIPFFIGNKKALIKNKRFVDADLNRCFPGKKCGNYEEKRAKELLEKIKNFDYIIDLHSSSNKCPLFGILTKPNRGKIKLAKKLGLRRLVIMKKSFASGKSLIDFAKCGISLEIGPHRRKKNIREVSSVINNLIENKGIEVPVEIFEVFDVIKKTGKKIYVKNFEFVKKGQQISDNQHAEYDFIPILVGEESYKGVTCLAARKVNLKDTDFYN